MSYREALAWLFGTQLFGIKLGLDNIRRLLDALDVPSPEQRIIHVAGTNGKGSVCAMIESIARAAGYRTGLFTSPHLITFRERIQVSGDMIGKVEVADGLTMIRDLVCDWDPHPTFFEIATALGLHHFSAHGCDVIVLETGMGGRLDATNAVTPAASVITPVALDHQKWLGQTLTAIASEKAGIIKPGVPVVSARQVPEVEAVLREKASDCGALLEFVLALNGEHRIALAGSHQKENATLALAALRAANVETHLVAITTGLATVCWPARFQRWDDRIIIDGAHNPAGATVLAQTWRDTYGQERATVILATLQDKDAAAMIAVLLPIAARFVLLQARTERAIPPEQLATMIGEIAPGFPVVIAPSLAAALDVARSAEQRVLVTGSLHFAGEVLAALGGNPEDLEDCLQ